MSYTDYWTIGRKMQLPNSYYEHSADRPAPSPPLLSDIDVDVCVIGAGFCGLNVAIELAKAGYRVALLEQHCVGFGASGRSGGQFIYGYATGDFERFARRHGLDARALFAVSTDALDLVRARIKEYAIDCDLAPGYLCAAIKPRQVRQLREECDLLRAAYDYEVAFLDEAETQAAIASTRYIGSLRDENSGHLHPLKYVLGLAQAARSHGVQIFEQTRALGFEQKQGRVHVVCPGATVAATSAVVTVNAFANESLLQHHYRKVMPVGTYICATEPLDAPLIANNAGVVDCNFVLDYFRMSADARLLFGGRASYRASEDIAKFSDELRRRMTLVFPQLREVKIDFTWGGNVGITRSRFPSVGRAAHNIYYAQGFSGHGVAMTNILGVLLAAAIRGDNEKFDMFAGVSHADFIGGKLLRTPLLVLAMLYFKIKDLL